LKAGDEVIGVDGKPVAAALATAWKHVVGSSELGKLNQAVGHMLGGPPDHPLKLEVRRATNGRDEIVKVARSGGLGEPTLRVRAVAGVPVIRIVRWSNDKGFDLQAEVDMILDRNQGRPIIFDVRGNGGGDDPMARRVAARFLRAPVISSVCFARQAGTENFTHALDVTEPRVPRFTGRAAVLIDSGCYSATISFITTMADGGALLCGETADGACCRAREIKLPGNAKVRVCTTVCLNTCGLPSPLIGIAPHLRKPRTCDAIRNGRDDALLAALEWVKGMQSRPPRAQIFAP
jgi:C-terminal processing protease CtpA/Prc